MKADRSELAIWAVGTWFTTYELVREYLDYCTREIEWGRDPLTESRWADEVMRLDNIEEPDHA